jgi:hypothetical protein
MKEYLLVLGIIFLCCSTSFADGDISTLLQTGKTAIENGEYTKAVDCLGKILDASGNQTNDDKIVAFGATVQAYGVWKTNSPQMDSTVIEYLNKAIIRDPSWEYPKKLLKEVDSKK